MNSLEARRHYSLFIAKSSGKVAAPPEIPHRIIRSGRRRQDTSASARQPPPTGHAVAAAARHRTGQERPDLVPIAQPGGDLALQY
jgi:hypothetical protein